MVSAEGIGMKFQILLKSTLCPKHSFSARNIRLVNTGPMWIYLWLKNDSYSTFANQLHAYWHFTDFRLDLLGGRKTWKNIVKRRLNILMEFWWTYSRHHINSWYQRDARIQTMPINGYDFTEKENIIKIVLSTYLGIGFPDFLKYRRLH